MNGLTIPACSMHHVSTNVSGSIKKTFPHPKRPTEFTSEDLRIEINIKTNRSE